MVKKTKGSSGKGKSRSASTGRYVTTKSAKGVSREAREFSRRFNKQYRDTLRDLSKR